jgi:hypothetical protein
MDNKTISSTGDAVKPLSKQQLIQQEIQKILAKNCDNLSLYKLNKNTAPKGKHCNETINLGFKYVICPSLFCFYPFGLLFAPQMCMNHDTTYSVSLFWSIMGIYLAGLILLSVKMWIFVCNAKFCTALHLANHELLNWAIFLDYASILLAYELYAYTVNFFAGLAVFIFWVLFFLLYGSVFLEGHVRPCPALITGESRKGAGNSFNKCLLICTLLVQFAFPIVAIIFNSQLTENWRVSKETSGECLTPS